MGGIEGVEEVEQEYLLLKDLEVEVKRGGGEGNGVGDDGEFTLCFWIYIDDFSSLPCVILHQGQPESTSCFPFLSFNSRKQMMLFPFLFPHQEAPAPGNSITPEEVPCASTKIEFPIKKWVHVGCEVLRDLVRLHIDGEVVEEKPLNSLINKVLDADGQNGVSLAWIKGDEGGVWSYVHGVEVLLPASSVKTNFVKDPPLLLSIDHSSASEIEEGSDGVWSIVGGKASCRRNFSLDVILLDALGNPVDQEMEVVASLLYANNGAPVENTSDAEPPLLASCDGIEYASWDRPSKLVNGRASFKLKITQLSSKCDNRLFRIRFNILKISRLPFFEVLSVPIRCVSRSRNMRMSPLPWRKVPPGSYLLNGCQSTQLDGSTELLHNVVSEAKQNPLSKRVKLGHDKPFAMFKDDLPLKQANEKPNYHVLTKRQDENAYSTRMFVRPDNLGSDTESSEATNSDPRRNSSIARPISDLIVFKYCLGSLDERSHLLKEIVTSASKEELVDFSKQVSVYSGCSHNRHQIAIAKRLLEEGTKTWASISQNNQHALWENLIHGIKEPFMRIARCSRPLTHQDCECLRRIAGCQDLVSPESFEKLWRWLYPVAYTLSQDSVNMMWDSLSPKWIEGFITKEEAESLLQGSGNLEDPGTFILRFPTSRSWPHPDAGSLVVTYVGSNYTIHHRLLSLDLIDKSGARGTPRKPLQDMLLEEPELSRLGRTIRSHWLQKR